MCVSVTRVAGGPVTLFFSSFGQRVALLTTPKNTFFLIRITPAIVLIKNLSNALIVCWREGYAISLRTLAEGAPEVVLALPLSDCCLCEDKGPRNIR